jgi:tetratricopeptide (TPR) repeat protein
LSILVVALAQVFNRVEAKPPQTLAPQPSDVPSPIGSGKYDHAAHDPTEMSRRVLGGTRPRRNNRIAWLEENDARHAASQETSLKTIEPRLKRAAQENPRSFEANHNLGELYVQMGQLSNAIHYLEIAYHIDPSHYVNAYDLALAYLETHNFSAGRRQVQDMLKQQDKAELHNLLGEIEERSGRIIEAANEYQRAFKSDPTEQNTFDWACELLMHHTFEPAIVVFKYGGDHYPTSARLWIGLGISFYSRGRYDDAVAAFLRATDLNPADPHPYIFLGVAYKFATKDDSEVAAHMKRFTELNPDNAQGFYYYALTLWRGGRSRGLQVDLGQLVTLLEKSISLDPTFPDAHVQLGIVYEEQKKYSESVKEWERAVKLKPDLADAHYRLGRAYSRIGQKERAQGEFDLYTRFHEQQAEQEEKARKDMRIFVYSMKENSSPTP